MKKLSLLLFLLMLSFNSYAERTISSDDIDVLISIGSLFAFSFILTLGIYYLNSGWAFTGQHSLTLFFLPQITFVVTTVISGDLALSLGLVGALSIVRFRHPVRSSLELTMYFLVISAGICAGVNVVWVWVLLLICTCLVFGSVLISKLVPERYLFKSIFTLKAAASDDYVVEVRVSEKIDLMENLKHMTDYSVTKDSSGNNEISYIYRFDQKVLAMNLVERLEGRSEILDIKFSKVNFIAV